MKVRVLSPALDDITQAASWLESKRVGLGGEFWQSVDAMLTRIEDNPLQFAKSKFATSESEIRVAVIRRFGYVIHFLIEADEAQIVAVTHGSRDAAHWRRRLKRQ